MPLVSWAAPANTSEGCLLFPSVARCWRRWHWRPDVVVGDMGYIDASTKQRLRERWQVAVVTRLKENMNLVPPFETPTQAACPQGQPLRWLGYESSQLGLSQVFLNSLRLTWTMCLLADAAVLLRYCRQYAPGHAEPIAQVFRNMRRELAPQRGQERETWLQVLRIGDVALVGVPAEFFTQLGLDLKNRSPFRHTYIAELANDWIGYLPNREGHKLGGCQCWTGTHSYAEPGTGERMVDEAVAMLQELAR